jgi:hypothetical protein
MKNCIHPIDMEGGSVLGHPLIAAVRLISVIAALLLMAGMKALLAADPYVLPIGVPNPWIAPDLAAPPPPASWTTEIPGYYYVDYDAAGSTDSNRPNGTPTAPRKSIPLTITAGSRVEVHGTVRAGELHLKAEGTADEWTAGVRGPVWLVGAGVTSPDFVSRIFLRGSYFYVDNFRFVTPSNLQVGSAYSEYAADHILVRNCELVGNGAVTTACVIIGKETSKVSNVIFFRNHVHDYGNMDTKVDEDASVGIVGSHCYDVWVLNNHMHTATAGFRVGGAYSDELPEYTRRIFVAGNDVHNILQSGLFVKYAKDVVFSSNHVYDIVDTPWSPSKCMGAQYGPDGFWMIFNRLNNARYGIFIGSTDGMVQPWPTYCIGNVISNIQNTVEPYTDRAGWGDAAIMMAGSARRYVVDNTIYNCVSGIQTPGGGTVATYLFNNIVAKITNSAGYHIFIDTYSNDSLVDYNLFGGPGSERIRWGAATYNLTQFQANTSNGDNCLVADPLFASAEAGNLRLRMESPAINKGSGTIIANLNALYQTTFGAGISRDIEGATRPSGGAWDIGAYEWYQSSGNPPKAPANLKVVPQ